MFTKNDTDFDSDLTDYDYDKISEEEGKDVEMEYSDKEEEWNEEKVQRSAVQKLHEMKQTEAQVNKTGVLFQKYYALASSWKEKLVILEVGFSSLHSI